MNKIKAIFYDFDGVIKDSTAVKTKAFYNLYLPFGKDIADQVIEHHLKHGGVSRYEKFKHYHNVFLGENLNEEGIELWATKFSELVLEAVIESPYVSGAIESLKALQGSVQQFVITGTPQKEIDFIIKKIGLSDYFMKICGTPKNKIDWSTELLEEFNLNKESVLFVGDALTDYKAAQHHGFSFFLRSHKENLKYFKNIDVPKFENLNNLVTFVNKNQV